MAVLQNHLHVTLDELEENLSMFKLEDYIKECEADFDSKVQAVAQHLVDNHGIRAVFISGPSASGKTTLNAKLEAELIKHDIKAVSVSLDDYYFSHEFDTDEFGRFDYESISTLDTELVISNIKDLIGGRMVRLPSFDFMTKSRIMKDERETVLQEDGILLVEGLHGLAHQIAGLIPPEQWLGIFIMPYATLTDDYTLLDQRDMRILRRLVRDALNRGANALATIDYWPMLDKAEITNFPEYLANAHIYINTALPYEFYCIAPLAKKMIEDALFDYRHANVRNSRLNKFGGFAQTDLALETAYRLHAAVSKIPGISTDLVPQDSLLNEFTRKNSREN